MGRGPLTTNTDTHQHSPEDKETNNRDGRRGSRQGLGQRSEDDDDQLQPIHPLTTHDIGKSTEPNLTYDRTSRRRNFDGRIRIGRDVSGLALCVVPVDDTQHGGNQVDGEDIVGIGEETNARHDNGAHMVPAEGSLVDLGESKSSTFIGVGDVSVVVVEVVEGSIAAGCLLGHCASAPRVFNKCRAGKGSQRRNGG